MAVTVKNIIPAKLAESTQTGQYVAVSARCIIDKFTAVNVTTINRSINVNIVPSGGTASVNNVVSLSRVIAPNETYTFPELVGHVLEIGSTISTLASAAASISIRASGREITA